MASGDERASQPRPQRRPHRRGRRTQGIPRGDQRGVSRHRGADLHCAAFVAVLGASFYTYAEATRTQQLPDWVGANTRMLEFFHGCPSVYVPDNLKSAINNPCRYEPEVNRTFDDFAAHYGGVVISARSAKPKDNLIRNSMQLASWKQRKALAQALKPIYQADNAETAEQALSEFEQDEWGQLFPTVAQS